MMNGKEAEMDRNLYTKKVLTLMMIDCQGLIHLSLLGLIRVKNIESSKIGKTPSNTGACMEKMDARLGLIGRWVNWLVGWAESAYRSGVDVNSLVNCPKIRPWRFAVDHEWVCESGQEKWSCLVVGPLDSQSITWYTLVVLPVTYHDWTWAYVRCPTME